MRSFARTHASAGVSEPRVMVVSSAPPSWKELTAITSATHRKWCDTHGYKYHLDVSDISIPASTPWVNEKVSGYTPLRTMVKFLLLAHYMDKESCREEYDYVVWLDADLVVSHSGLRATRWFAPDSWDSPSHDPEVVLAYDVNGLHPTVIMLRNTVTTRGLVWACNEAGNRMFVSHGWSDIMALRFFLETPPYRDLVRYISAQQLCAMPPGVHPMPADVRRQYEWTAESFSLHLSALSLERRIELASAFVAERKLL